MSLIPVKEHIYTDPNTDFMWASNCNLTDSKMEWEYARNWARSLNYGGYCDWRLPSIEELEALLSKGGSNWRKWLIANGFTKIKSGHYWSKSSYFQKSRKVWVVWCIKLIGKEQVCGVNEDEMGFVMPVRDGKSKCISRRRKIISSSTPDLETSYNINNEPIVNKPDYACLVCHKILGKRSDLIEYRENLDLKADDKNITIICPHCNTTQLASKDSYSVELFKYYGHGPDEDEPRYNVNSPESGQWG